MDKSGKMTDGMAALAFPPIGNLLFRLSNGPIWERGEGVEAEEGDGKVWGWRVLTSSVRTADLLTSIDSRVL